MQELYTINHVALMSGLSSRTIRNYMKMGFIEGEMINGVWHFSAENVGAFFVNPNVAPAIQAKRNALIFDFLSNDYKKQDEMCTVIDHQATLEEANAMSEFFCDAINRGMGGHRQLRLQLQWELGAGHSDGPGGRSSAVAYLL